MNVTAMVTKLEPTQEREHNFEISSADLFPAAIDEILETIKEGGEKAREIVRGNRLDKTPVFSQYLPRALRLPAGAWEMAKQEPTTDMTEETLAIRAEALEVARLWFTELLHSAVHNEPMRLRIVKAPGNPHRLAL